MSKAQVKEFTKRLVVNAVKNVLPITGPAQFAMDVAQDFYDVFLSASPGDRQALTQAAQSLSEAERQALVADIERSGGTEAAQAARGVIETLRAAPAHDRLRQSVNVNMLGGRGFSPRPLSPQQRAVGAAVAASFMAPPSTGQMSRAPHPSTWPRIDGFELKGFLGAGAFAQVFLAQELDEQGQVRRACALKVGDLHDLGRFRREVRALESVSHPHVIDFYGAGVLEDPPPPRFWIAMPNLSGLTLGDLMRQGLDEEQKLVLALQVLAGLEALHAQGVAHRDLKPDNALISDDFEVKLTDFGLSKDEGTGSGQSLATMQGEMMGTPAYMSPEQVDGKPSNTEADVWAFGVMIFELFTGHLLFQGDSVGRVFSNVLSQTISIEHPQLPSDLEEVLANCIHRDLKQRYPHAQALAQAFRPVAEHLRKRLRHARYRGTWTAVIEGQWIEHFATEHQGTLPDNPVQAFIKRWPEAHRVDPERLAEILPKVFQAQSALESLRRGTQNYRTDWAAEVQQAESAAVAQLGIDTMEEALARAGEVEQAKNSARASVERRRSDEERQTQQAQAQIEHAQARVSEVLRQVLREELSDYDQLLAEREQQRKAREAQVRAEVEAQAQAEAHAEAQRKARKRIIFMVIASTLAIGFAWAWMEVQAERERVEAIETRKSMTWIEVPTGSFRMGSNQSPDEKPIHQVEVESFLMSETEVTVGQYRKCVEAGRCTEPDSCSWGSPNWSSSASDQEDHPINCVDWGQARTFAVWIGGDLPTEAQWEYAARGGENYTYSGSNDVDQVGWYSNNSGSTTQPVKTKKANGYGLYDMSGNVWEWTLDEWHGDYNGAPSRAEKSWGDVGKCKQRCDIGSSRRVRRGGSWRYVARYLRVADRSNDAPDFRRYDLGFRVRRTLP